MTQVAESSVFYKTKMCSFFAKGRCTKGDTCNYSHEKVQQRAKPDLFRTQLCPELLSGGECMRKQCRYAHADSEVRVLAGIQPHHPGNLILSRPSPEVNGASVGDAGSRMHQYQHAVYPQLHCLETNPTLVQHEVKQLSARGDLSTVPGDKRAAVTVPILLGRMSQGGSEMGAMHVSQNTDLTRPTCGPKMSLTRTNSDGSEGATEVVLLEKNTFLSLEPSKPSLCVRHLKSTPGRLTSRLLSN